MRKVQCRGKGQQIAWLDRRNLARDSAQWHKLVYDEADRQTRHIGASKVRRRNSDFIEINVSITDLSGVMSDHHICDGDVTDEILSKAHDQMIEAFALSPEQMEEQEQPTIGEMKERLNRVGFDFK
ncbi:hypothetical protein pEaSNUABM11_00102 [Erwinia phage pEa_SNUABM_11]|nr:hypothetical protein pEaSNUABM11_00102 [Erwinia phage pEa_SNUABM_11]